MRKPTLSAARFHSTLQIHAGDFNESRAGVELHIGGQIIIGAVEIELVGVAGVTDVPFLHLRDIVGRRASKQYKFFYLKKRVPGRRRVRMISVPDFTLKELQRWIVDNILRHTRAHPASYAFHPNSRPLEAVEEHCGCAWLLKIDLEEFFHSISEGRVAEVFSQLGFLASHRG